MDLDDCRIGHREFHVRTGVMAGLPNCVTTRERRKQRSHFWCRMLSPKRIVAFDLVDGVWVTEVRCALPVALALRQSLIELSSIRYAGEGQQTKMELVTALGIIARIVFS